MKLRIKYENLVYDFFLYSEVSFWHMLFYLSGQKPSLIFAARDSIRRISFNPFGMQPVASDLSSAIGVTYDVAEEQVYWADNRDMSIYKVPFSDPQMKSRVKVFNERSIVDALAVDWIGRKLYWTDTGLKTLEVSEMDGSSTLVLLNTGMLEPRGIALDPTDQGRYGTGIRYITSCFCLLCMLLKPLFA